MPRNRTRRRADSATLNGSSSAQLPPRSKAGCWTCRIRRKRCDEQQDDSGSCQACVRLDIECLGWGTRRPDWCRDKEKLNQYKLSLKRKLCSRAGTRPSASKLANSNHQALTRQAVNSNNVDVTRAPSGESPVLSSSSVIGGEDDEELETDDYFTTPFTPATNTLPGDSPTLYFSPQQHQPVDQQWQALPAVMAQHPAPLLLHYPSKQKPSPLSILSPSLSTLLATSSTSSSSIPAEFASLLSQLIDLYQYKSRLFSKPSSSGAAEQEIAHRAQAIEVELSRLSNRAQFDSLFSSALGGSSGFGFDTSIFLAATTSPTSVGNNGPSGTDIFSSPMTMWSPDLMSDAMSTFSGSSAPTSPAAPLLAMAAASNSYNPFNDFLGYDNNNLSLFDSSSYTHHQSMGGALGLSSDFGSYNTAAPTPAISVLPPTRAATMEMDMNKTAPSITSPQDVDPFQIHHETCSLLLQAVLSNENPHLSSTFDSVASPFSLESSFSPIEDCLQRLTTKFSPLVQQGGVSAEYLFSATLAGAMSSSNGRRAFFRDIVRGIEERSGSIIGVTLLNEAWAN